MQGAGFSKSLWFPVGRVGWAGCGAAAGLGWNCSSTALECRSPRVAELKPCLAAGCDFVRISECRVLHTNPDWQLELGSFQHGVADFSGVKQCPSVSGLSLQSK